MLAIRNGVHNICFCPESLAFSVFGGVYFCFLSHKRHCCMSNEILLTDKVSAAVWNSINPMSCSDQNYS